MKHSITVFNDKYPLLGPLIFTATIEYYVIQLIAGLAFVPTYSLAKNTISDLGNTKCPVYDNRFVCSPDHLLMNISFVVLGLIMIIGSMLLMQEFKKNKYTVTGFYMMMIAGIGALLVGVFPENTVSAMHELGAGLAFIIGNIGVILIGLDKLLTKTIRAFSIICGAVGLVGFILFITKTYLGLGEGGMERITAYPQSIWLILFGLYIFSKRYKRVSDNT